ncbi:MAG: ATP-binding protein [bacterium]
MKTDERFYKWLISVAEGLTIAFFILLGWQSWRSYQDIQTLVTTGSSLNESNALIGQFDEALTMSARMAAATGNRQWEARYLLLEPQLDEAIQTVKKLAPDLVATKSAQKTDEANQILVEMEHRSFKLIEQGQQEAAKALLASPEYEDAKRTYARGFQQIRDGLAERSASLLHVAKNRLTFNLTLTGILLPSLLLLWAWVIRLAQQLSTRRLAAEMALKEAHDYLNNLFNHAYAPIIVWDPQFRITRFNHAFEELTGRRANEVLGKSPAILFPPSLVAGAMSFLSKTQTGALGETAELTIQHLDGSVRTVLWNSATLNAPDGGTPLATIAQVNDITERKRVEEEKSKLEEKNRQLQKTESLGRMAGAIAHHFNNKLHGVMGNLELATGLLPGGSTESEFAKCVTEALQGVHEASKMSVMMLSYLGLNCCTKEPLDLSECCRRYLPHLICVLPWNTVLKTDLPVPGPTINANASEIEVVLANLITNAWEARRFDGSTIRLSVKTVPVETISTTHRFPLDCILQEKTYACLEVSDSGCGITEKDIESLFDPFFSTKFAGRGLGLSVVQGIAKACSGTITVESKPGSGSTFRVFFPVFSDAIAQS